MMTMPQLGPAGGRYLQRFVVQPRSSAPEIHRKHVATPTHLRQRRELVHIQHMVCDPTHCLLDRISLASPSLSLFTRPRYWAQPTLPGVNTRSHVLVPPPFFFVTTSRRRDFMWVSASCLNVGWDTTATTCINHIPRPHWRILWFFPAQDFTG